jgi:RNA polymerase sigma-70 factor, ECF subfamily
VQWLVGVCCSYPPQHASGGGDLIRVDLCREANRLCRAVVTPLPDEPEASGLLALMLFQGSRRAARLDAAGELVTLEDQDRARWDHAEIAEAELGHRLARW